MGDTAPLADRGQRDWHTRSDRPSHLLLGCAAAPASREGLPEQGRFSAQHCQCVHAHGVSRHLRPFESTPEEQGTLRDSRNPRRQDPTCRVPGSQDSRYAHLHVVKGLCHEAVRMPFRERAAAGSQRAFCARPSVCAPHLSLPQPEICTIEHI